MDEEKSLGKKGKKIYKFFPISYYTVVCLRTHTYTKK